MAGLLDFMGSSFDDPKTAATLRLAQGLLSSPRVMQGAAQGLLDYNQTINQAKRAKMLEEAQMLQLEQAKAEAARRQGVDAAYRNAMRTPQQMAMGANGGPTVAAAQAAPSMAPGIDQNALIQGLMQADPQMAFQMLQPKPADYKVVGDALVSVGPGGVKEAYRAPPKAEADPSAVREYKFAQSQGYPGTFQQFQLEQKRAGATSLSVNTGPKAFDNELGRSAVELLMRERESAQASAGVLQSIGEIRRAVQGGAYQGTGAELKLGAAKAMSALGMPYDAKTVANSELFSAQANQFVLNSIKQLGANPSNSDREFIEKTVPRLQTDPAALPSLLSFLERKAQGQLRGYNNKAKSVQRSAEFLPFGLDVAEPGSTGQVIDFGSLK